MIDKGLSLCPGGQAATPASTTRSQHRRTRLRNAPGPLHIAASLPTRIADPQPISPYAQARRW
jgi:hypothetical protein